VTDDVSSAVRAHFRIPRRHVRMSAQLNSATVKVAASNAAFDMHQDNY